MGNNINIGNDNKIKDANIAGNNVNVSASNNKNKFWKWVLKHFEAIIAAIISGATSAFVAWLITYFCSR